MFLQTLRQSIGYFTNSLRRGRTCPKTWTSLTDVEQLLIFADIDTQDTFGAYNKMRKQLKELCPRAQFTSILFVEKDTLTNFTGISDYEKEFISADSFSFFFKIEDADIASKFNVDYDLTINLCDAYHPYLDFLFPCVGAGLKVGRSGVRDAHLNFMISHGGTTADLCHDIVEHLKMFFAKP